MNLILQSDQLGFSIQNLTQNIKINLYFHFRIESFINLSSNIQIYYK